MTSLRTLRLAAATIALLAPLSAHAAVPDGWYLGANGNLGFQNTADSKLDGETNKVGFRTGWGVGGYGGYGLGNGIRVEGEVAYRNSQVNKVTGVGAGTAGGGIRNTALMGNALYEYDTRTRITPYIGAGAGVSFVKANNMRTINTAEIRSKKTAFAYQGIAGFALNLEGGWDFTADYRYFATPDVKFKADTGGRATTENSSHNLMLGIRYVFDRPRAPEPRVEEPVPMPPPPPAVTMPVPQPVMAPAVAPIPQNYMVFFDFDKSVITAEAERIIASAAESFRAGNYVRLIVTGHTDTMGTARYNQALSERRAAAVKAAFIRHGIPASDITPRGVGKNELMIPTADQVREAQNRRAEIVMQR
ncbi:MAG: OmpA family protein [Alphaproteobacteria bacterium]|nr:OmpA family protein [Alphaproteobacteria bacterium]